MTSPECPSGSDRVREVARQIDADIYVNIQGDEPTLTPDFFPPLLASSTGLEVEVPRSPSAARPRSFANPNAVKVVTALDGRALYFSRATIPFDRDGAGFVLATASTSASTPTARPRWSALPPCRPRPLERTERLEQLRLLENGIALYVLPKPLATPSAWIRKRICCEPKRC
jgi:3-deoxy-manno-octulosonate cytidylyltransferase (CMP-KDO synthetase)